MEQTLKCKILIASPGDVSQERDIVCDVIYNWNSMNADDMGVVLLPIRWEVDSVPQIGARPQEILNTQLVDQADILVGVFWTRLGSPTGAAESGTAEEIERFRKAGKPALIYISDRQVSPSKIDIKQYRSLQKYKIELSQNGLLGAFSNHADFRSKLQDHLSKTVRKIIADNALQQSAAVSTEAENSNTIEHDKNVFFRSDEILNERFLIDFIGWLDNNHSFRNSQFTIIVRYLDHFRETGNRYLLRELVEKSLDVVAAIRDLLNFTAYNFWVYPRSQTEDFRYCMHPELNMDQEGSGSSADITKYESYEKQLYQLTDQVKSAYMVYRTAVKQNLYI